MVTRGRDAEAGKARGGCLLSLLAFAFGLYVGVQYFAVRLRWYRIQDAVHEQADFAPALDDATIKSRLMQVSDDLHLPYTLRDWTVRRGRDQRNTRTITISAPPYQDSVVVKLPGFRKLWTFTSQPGTSETY